jgi:hypothetical protein
MSADLDQPLAALASAQARAGENGLFRNTMLLLNSWEHRERTFRRTTASAIIGKSVEQVEANLAQILVSIVPDPAFYYSI